MRKIIGNTVGTTMSPQKIASIGQKTKLSEFENDKGYITSEGVPTMLSQLDNDKGFVTQGYVDNTVNNIVNSFSSALTEVIDYQESMIGE